MKRRFALLRMLVLVGCLPLILRNVDLGRVGAQSGCQGSGANAPKEVRCRGYFELLTC